MTVNDGHGGTATQTVSITITGTNDAAVITGAATGTVVEDTAATLVTAGKLNIADVDTGEFELRRAGQCCRHLWHFRA